MTISNKLPKYSPIVSKDLTLTAPWEAWFRNFANASLVLDESARGIVVQNSASATLIRSLIAGTGINITNGDGVSGNPTIAVSNISQSSVTNLTSDLANKQTLDSELTAIAGLTSAADTLPYFTGAGTASLATFTAAGRALVDDASASAQRSTLGFTNALVKRSYTQTGAVATTTTTTPTDDTIPQNTEGGEFMSLSHTPLDAANILEITITASLSPSVTAWVAGHLHQDSVADAIAANRTYVDTGTAADSLVFTHTMVAGTTSATTFKFRAGMNTAGTLTFNGSSGVRVFGGVMASSIVIKEYTP